MKNIYKKYSKNIKIKITLFIERIIIYLYIFRPSKYHLNFNKDNFSKKFIRKYKWRNSKEIIYKLVYKYFSENFYLTKRKELEVSKWNFKILLNTNTIY